MNSKRREEIRVIAECPNDMHWAQEMRRAVAELLAHIDALEQAAAKRVIADGGRGPTPDYTGEGSAWVPPVEERAVVVPELTESKITSVVGGPQTATGGYGYLRLGFKHGWGACAKEIRAIPADRALGKGMVAVPAAVVPESLLHDLAVAAWDEGADAGMAWDPDADPATRGVVPCTPEEGIAKARDHFAKHGSGSPSSAFSRALQAIRENSRAIPADRVLGDGMRQVDARRFARMQFEEAERPYLLELERYVRAVAKLQNWSKDTTDHGPLSSLDRLRANQGGAAT